MSDCRFGVSPVNYPDPDPDSQVHENGCYNVISRLSVGNFTIKQEIMLF